MLSLPSSEIHLWFAFCQEGIGADLLRQYRRLLCEEETAREGRFQAATDRERFLLTRVLVRTVLSRYAAVTAQDWRFSTDSHGRPHIANPGIDSRQLRFSISHTMGLVLLGVTSRAAIGVDTENTAVRTASVNLAERYFSRTEAQDVRGSSGLPQSQRFFDYWTLKESYIKARGLGLALPLAQFAFDLQGPGLSMTMDPELGDDPLRWIFWLMSASPAHTVAVCAEHCGRDVTRLVMRKVVPLRSEQQFDCTAIRRSL